MKQKRKFMLTAMVCSALAGLSMGQIVGAQDTATGTADMPAYTLNPIVVTATRTDEHLQNVPANLTVVKGSTIRAAHDTNMTQVLQNVPGVTVNNYGTGIGYALTNGLYINGSSNIVYMVDGIPMNSGGVNPPFLDMQNMQGIQRVEVLKGAASALYGSNAEGGVINVITEKPSVGVHTKVGLSGGSYHTLNYNITNEGREGNVYWRGTYLHDQQRDFTDGHGNRIPQHTDNHTGSFMIGADVDSKNNIEFYYNTWRANVMYSDSLRQLNTIRYGSEKMDSIRSIWKSQISDALSNRFTYANNHLNYLLDYYRTDVRTNEIGDQLTYKTGAHTLVGGFEWKHDNVRSSSFAGNRILHSMSYYLQDTWKITPRWTFTPGVRYDHYSSFGGKTSLHGALDYAFAKGTNAYVSYNQFFVAPTPIQLYYKSQWGTGNPNLKPIRGHEWDAGVKRQFNNHISGNIHGFIRRAKNDIRWATNMGTYENTGKEKAHGFSADLIDQITSRLSARLGYTYTKINATETMSANADGYIPKHAVQANIDYNAPKWGAHLSVQGVIDRPGPVNKVNSYRVFPKNTYWVTNISVNYNITPDITLWGRVNNLFDVFYATRSNVLYGGEGDWWTSPGRNYQVGVEYTF